MSAANRGRQGVESMSGYTNRRVPGCVWWMAVAMMCAGHASAQGVPANVYLDAAGGAGGNTVRASDDHPTAWYSLSTATVDQLWGLLPPGREGTVFEASGASGTEDAPLIRTTISGLIPGETYSVQIHFWSAATENWALLAGFSPATMTRFDRLGADGAVPGGAGVLNLNMGTGARLVDPLGGPAYAANGGTGILPSNHAQWNGVLAQDITSGLVYADGSSAASLSINTGREDDAAPGTINWGLSDLINRGGGSPEGLQVASGGGWASEVLHTYERENAAATTPRAPGFAIENLAAGRYDLYVVADNSYHTAAAGDNRQFYVYAGVGETTAGNTDYTGFARQTITNANWSTWQIGVNYARFTLDITSAGQDIIIVSQETSGLDGNALITCVQLVPLGDEGRIELRATLGEAVANAQGEIAVYVDDKPAASPAERSWYDGLSYQRILRATAPPFVTINDNAGWCWFQDERTIVHQGQLIVGSAANSAGTDGANRSGNIEIATYDLATGAPPTISVLHAQLQQDDHDDPAILLRPDGRFLAVYARHSNDKLIRARISQTPGDSTSWLPEATFTAGANVTYANVFRLADENGGRGRTYDFYRGEGFNPNVIISDDDGATWTYAGRLILMANQRPYVKYASNNRDEIHFAYTEGHPSEYGPGTGIYHAYLKGGNIYRSDGTLIRALNAGPIAPQEGTQIFAGNTANRGWIADLHLDYAGRPYLAYSVHQSNDDHRYHYARWDGTQWHDAEIAFAGQCLYASQVDYTGLVALDPQNPNRLWISTNADPVTGQPLISGSDGRRHWELFRGDTTDDGAHWNWTPLTANSEVDNLRPIMPFSDGRYTALLWLRGKYTSYTNYDLDAVAAVVPSADFDADFDVDASDLTAFVTCMTGPMRPYSLPPLLASCPLMPDAAGHVAADFDADGDVDQADFGIFQRQVTGR